MVKATAGAWAALGQRLAGLAWVYQLGRQLLEALFEVAGSPPMLLAAFAFGGRRHPAFPLALGAARAFQESLRCLLVPTCAARSGSLLLLLALAAPLLAGDPARNASSSSKEIAARQAALDRLASQEADPAEAPPPEASAGRAGGGAATESRRGRDLRSSRRVAAGQDAPPMVLIGGFLEVEKGGSVEGDVTVVGGGAQVAGKVYGTLVVVAGSVELGDGAPRSKATWSRWAARSASRGGTRVEGQKVQVAFGDFAGWE